MSRFYLVADLYSVQESIISLLLSLLFIAVELHESPFAVLACPLTGLEYAHFFTDTTTPRSWDAEVRAAAASCDPAIPEQGRAALSE
jgi:hypothetical protein